MDYPANTTRIDSAEFNRSNDDLDVLTEILAGFRKLEPATWERTLNAVATYLGIGVSQSAPRLTGTPHTTVYTNNLEATFSEDRSLSPKQFMIEKQPRTDVEKVACLAYYLTHYRANPQFRTLDISKLNTEAAQAKFANAAVAVENATKQKYLVPASKGSKQLSALGEQFVLALPDREKARTMMSNARPRRKVRRITKQQPEEHQ
jgi:hypothetical protein